MKRRHWVTRSPKAAKRRLLTALVLFLAALSVPIVLLVDRVYAQLADEQFFSASREAEGLAERIDQALQMALQKEKERPIAEYRFFNVLESSLLNASALKFSPLSELPPKTDVAGLIGYFQIDADGSFHIPALPDIDQGEASVLSADELTRRQALKARLQDLLSSKAAKADRELQVGAALRDEDAPVANENRRLYIVEQETDVQTQERDRLAGNAEAVTGEQLKQWRIDSEQWDKERKQKARSEKKAAASGDYKLRKETVKLPEQSLARAWRNRAKAQSDVRNEEAASIKAEASDAPATDAAAPAANVLAAQNPLVFSFESEVGPLQTLALPGRHLCFYRQVWHQKSRLTQGFVVAAEPFWQAVAQPLLNADSAGSASALLLHQGRIVQQFGGRSTGDEILLYRGSLLPPFQDYEVIVHAGALAEGPGKRIVDLLALSMAAILSIGLGVFYRLGAKQIELSQQQSNFIAAVSHELKTPLTSIRLYGEMLRSGWIADDGKKQGYYDYIFFESERLSRLIANVLQLARIDNGQGRLELSNCSACEWLARIVPKIAAHVEASGFKLNVGIHPDVKDRTVGANEDALSQIAINLVDNAVKFAASAAVRHVEVGFKPGKGRNEVVFYVRDYGPGIPGRRINKIFELFYRGEDEMTRTTPGTGIGLALARQLAESMKATLIAENKRPGVEFGILFESDRSAKNPKN